MGRDTKVCPYCGRIFTSVLCPKCGFSGDPERFRTGCPVCGHSGDFNAPGSFATPEIQAPKEPAPPVPVFMWIVAVVALGAALVALAFAMM